MDWQPIETAPRDGTEFLAYDVLTRKFDVCTVESVKRQDGETVWYPSRVQCDGNLGAFEGQFGYDMAGIQWWAKLEPPSVDDA